jgi:hypothetical protein
MYQTPISDQSNVARARGSNKQHMGLDMEGGAPNPSERRNIEPPPFSATSPSVSRAYARYGKPPDMKLVFGGILGFGAFLALIFQSYAHIFIVVSICAYGGAFCYWMYAKIMAKDTGTAEMRAVSDPIREGSQGFLKVQYGAISKLSVLVGLVVYHTVLKSWVVLHWVYLQQLLLL